jgi:hypothetical protein
LNCIRRKGNSTLQRQRLGLCARFRSASPLLRSLSPSRAPSVRIQRGYHRPGADRRLGRTLAASLRPPPAAMAQPLVVKKDDDLDEEGGYAAHLSAPLALPPPGPRSGAIRPGSPPRPWPLAFDRPTDRLLACSLSPQSTTRRSSASRREPCCRRPASSTIPSSTRADAARCAPLPNGVSFIPLLRDLADSPMLRVNAL